MIRPARPDDAEALGRGMKMVVDEGRWLATESSATVEELTGRFLDAFEAEHILLVLEEQGRLTGCVGLHPSAVAGVCALGMWVLPERRGQGAGRRLLEAVLAEARRRAVRKVELEVFPDNPRALALYASAGFELEGFRRDHYLREDGSLRSALLMALLLDPGEVGPPRR